MLEVATKLWVEHQRNAIRTRCPCRDSALLVNAEQSPLALFILHFLAPIFLPIDALVGYDRRW